MDVKPVTLTPLNNQQLYGKKAVLAGWGLTNEGEIADLLQKTRVKILPPMECGHKVQLVINETHVVEKNDICSAAEPYALTARVK